MNTLPNIQYNGWTNYETWRVNMEFFDQDLSYWSDTIYRYITNKYANLNEDWFNKDTDDFQGILYDFGCDLQDYNIEFIDDHCKNELLAGWLRSFISDVNYYEIAEALLNLYLDTPEFQNELREHYD